MTERRYTEAEVAAIFERASKTPAGADAPGDPSNGLTLAQMQEIGRAVGIPDHDVAVAARSIGVPRASVGMRLFGVPLSVSLKIPIARAVTNREWELIVAELRQTFGAQGNISTHGSLRSWWNGNLKVLLEPTPDGHQIRVSTVKEGAHGQVMGGIAATTAAIGLYWAALERQALGDTGMIAAIGLVGLVGLSMFGITIARLPGWARERQKQFDALAARIAHLADGPPTLSESGTESTSPPPSDEVLHNPDGHNR